LAYLHPNGRTILSPPLSHSAITRVERSSKVFTLALASVSSAPRHQIHPGSIETRLSVTSNSDWALNLVMPGSSGRSKTSAYPSAAAQLDCSALKAPPFLFSVSSTSAGHFSHTSHHPELRLHHPFNRRTAAGPAKTAPPQNISSATTTTSVAAIAFAAVEIPTNGRIGNTSHSGSEPTISTTPIRVTPRPPNYKRGSLPSWTSKCVAHKRPC